MVARSWTRPTSRDGVDDRWNKDFARAIIDAGVLGVAALLSLVGVVVLSLSVVTPAAVLSFSTGVLGVFET